LYDIIGKNISIKPSTSFSLAVRLTPAILA